MGYDSSDIVPCLIEQTMIAIILIHHEDGHISADNCMLEKCPHFKKCKISKNNFVIAALKGR
jgi:hypothetical protein